MNKDKAFENEAALDEDFWGAPECCETVERWLRLEPQEFRRRLGRLLAVARDDRRPEPLRAATGAAIHHLVGLRRRERRAAP